MSHPSLLYVGSYTPEMAGRGRGLTAYRRDTGTGALTQVGELELPAPSYLAWHPVLPVLYAVNEAGDGAVTAVACDGEGGMRVLGSLPSGGTAPCHLAASEDGRHLVVANYGGGSVAVFALGADGALLRRTELVEHSGHGPHPKRQEAPHVHMVVPGANGLWSAVDLGTDEVRSYRLGDEGTLEPVAVTALPPGSGPRQLVRVPGDQRTFLLTELGSTLTVAEERAPGVFALGAAVSASARSGAPDNLPAHLALDARARVLYVSNRGANTIALFRTDAESPTLIDEHSSGGKWPRHMTLVGQHLYVANQESDTLAVHTINPTDGSPALTYSYSTGSPVCTLSDQR